MSCNEIQNKHDTLINKMKLKEKANITTNDRNYEIMTRNSQSLKKVFK